MDKYLKMKNQELRNFIKNEIFNTSDYSDVKLEYRILDAIHWTLWAYGLDDEVYAWKDLESDDQVPHISCPAIQENSQYDAETWCDGYASKIWSFLVYLFGDYGISSRFGWIEDVDGFRKFIELVAYPLNEDE